MTTYYIDFNGGNDANDGLSFANRKKSFDGLISENDNSVNDNSIAGNEYRVMGMPAVNTGVNATWTKGGHGNRDANNNNIDVRAITNVTATSPIQITTSSAHGFTTGDIVFVYNVRGIPAANGGWVVTVTGTTTFTLNNSSGTGTYVSVGNDYAVLINHKGIKVNTGCKRIALCSGTTYTDNHTHNNNNNLYGVASSNITISRRGWFNVIHNLRIQIGNNFGTGKAWYYTLPETLDLSDYQKISFHYQNRSDSRPNTSHLSLKLCTDTTGDVAAHTVQIAGLGSRGRYPIVEDFGTNLNSAIKSVALYVDSDVGSEDLRFSNIIAVKDANDGVTHCDVVGKNTTAEPVWWQMQYIQEDLMIFGDCTSPNQDDYTSSRGDRTASYCNQSETVALHKVTPFNLYRNGQDHDDAGFAHKFIIRPRWDGRRTTNRVKVLGGWNTTDMSTQDSVTWVNWYRYTGTFIYNASDGNAAYFDVEKFGMCGAGHVAHLRGYDLTCKDMYHAGLCNAAAVRFDNLYGRSNFLIDGVYQTMGSSHGLWVDSQQGYAETNQAEVVCKNLHFYGGGHSQYYGHRALITHIESLHYYGHRWFFNTHYSETGKVYIKNLYASGFLYLHPKPEVYVHNSVIDNIVHEYYPHTINGSGSTAERFVAFRNYNGTANDHRLLQQAGCIKSETTVRHGTDGIAWKFEPKLEFSGDVSFAPRANADAAPFALDIATVFVEANKAVTFKAYLRRTNTGLTIRICAKKNRGENLFILASDVVVNCTAAADTWQEVTLSVTPIDSGPLSLTCEAFGGNSYTGYIDDISITQAP